MAKLDLKQLVDYAYKAGFRGADLTRAVARAMAESSGNTEATNLGGDVVGLMQIRQSVHPEFRGMNLRDPLENMRAAFDLFKREGWRPWKSSNLKALAYMPAAQLAVESHVPREIVEHGQEAASDAVRSAVGSVPGVREATEAANRVGSWFSTPQNILRISYVVVGVGLVIVGLVAVSVVAVSKMVPPEVKQTAKIATKLVK